MAKPAILKMLTGDPEAALTRAREALATVESDTATLWTEREAALVATEDIAVVDEIDRRIENRSRAARIHRDRIPALEARVQAAHAEKIEAERRATVAAILAKRDARAQAAAKLDQAVALVAAAYAELTAADDAVFANWPATVMPAHRLGYLSILRAEALSTMRKHRPMTPGCIPLLVEKQPFGFAAEVERLNAELADELTTAPVPASNEAAA